MERAMTVEERIRRAEEIYERRKRNEGLTVVNDEKIQKEKNDKKDVKLLKKMIIQLIVCICIYLVIYTIQNNQYIFSEDFINKVNEIISYDIDFPKVYEDAKKYLMGLFSSQTENENQEQIGTIYTGNRYTVNLLCGHDTNTNEVDKIKYFVIGYYNKNFDIHSIYVEL